MHLAGFRLAYPLTAFPQKALGDLAAANRGVRVRVNRGDAVKHQVSCAVSIMLQPLIFREDSDHIALAYALALVALVVKFLVKSNASHFDPLFSKYCF